MELGTLNTRGLSEKEGEFDILGLSILAKNKKKCRTGIVSPNVTFSYYTCRILCFFLESLRYNSTF